MKLKPPKHPAPRRGLLRSTLDDGAAQASRKALGSLMQGYKLQEGKPSSGTREPSRKKPGRAGSAGGGINFGGLEHAFDRMVAEALTGGLHTTGVLSSVFRLAPRLIGR
jgi:hypothetical protein